LAPGDAGMNTQVKSTTVADNNGLLITNEKEKLRHEISIALGISADSMPLMPLEWLGLFED